MTVESQVERQLNLWEPLYTERRNHSLDSGQDNKFHYILSLVVFAFWDRSFSTATQYLTSLKHRQL